MCKLWVNFLRAVYVSKGSPAKVKKNGCQFSFSLLLTSCIPFFNLRETVVELKCDKSNTDPFVTTVGDSETYLVYVSYNGENHDPLLPGFHLRGGGGRRGSFPPKQLNFPPKLTQLPPQDIANNYNYEVYPPFTVALQPHDP